MLLDQLLASVKVRAAVESSVDLTVIARKLGILALKLGLARDFWHANYRAKVIQCEFLERQMSYKTDQLNSLYTQKGQLQDEIAHLLDRIDYLKKQVPPNRHHH